MKDKQRDEEEIKYYTTAADTRDVTAKEEREKTTSCESCSVKMGCKKRFNLQRRLLRRVERAESQSEEPSTCPSDELHANTAHPVSSCFMIRSLSYTPCVNMI